MHKINNAQKGKIFLGRLFGTDGVRGIANKELDCETAMEIGRAGAAVLADKGRRRPVFVVGMDTRTSSDMLSCALIAGLCSMGADVINLGVVSTPAVAFLVVKYKADAGVMISASHNPAEYNGIKIFSGNGFKLPDMLEEQIEDIVLKKRDLPQLPAGDEVGRVNVAPDAEKDYCDHIKSTALYSLDGMNIAVDLANGAACKTAERIFDELGANAHVLNSEPDGSNINKNCGSTNMKMLSRYVVENHLDAGVAFDGDADRCLFVDEKGELVDGDEIMAICALDLKERGRLQKNTVVGTVMSNLGLVRFCEENDIRFVSTKVGDRFVLEEMLLEDTFFGGEQSGHIIFRDFATTGDGQLTAVQVLSLMRRKDEKLSQLRSVIRKYPQVILNVKVGNDEKLRFYTDETIKNAIDDAKSTLGNRGRIVVRPSGTEPLIRIMAEGEDLKETKSIAEKIEAVIKKEL